MKARVCALAACLAGVVLAAAPPPVSVSDLVGTVTAAFAVDGDDPRIARSITDIRLSERLSATVIAMLYQMGAGPVTIRELNSLARKSKDLALPTQDPLSLTPTPSAKEQAAMVDAMRHYAAGYLASLPDFTCTREARRFRIRGVVRHLVAGQNDTEVHSEGELDRRWVESGSYAVEASFVQGRDHYKVTLVNNKPTKLTFEQIEQRVTSGEFGGMLRETFEPQPLFQWDHWEVVDGKRTAAFTYYVDAAHSEYWLCCPRVTTAHRGLVLADPQTGAIRRLILYATGLTSAMPVSAAGHVLDYAEVSIGGRSYLLPRKSLGYNRSGDSEAREEIEYSDYRKFGSDATIVFPTEGTPEK